MDTTYTDVSDGERLDIAVEFISRRAVDGGDGRVHRLVVADRAGEQFPVLAPVDSDPLLGLKTGAAYRFSSLLGAAPPARTADVAADCPTCGGDLRTGGTVDAVGSAVARAAAQLGLDDPFAVADATTTVRRVRGPRTPVDDRTPMDRDDSVVPPDYACASCGRQFDESDLRDDGRVDG